MNLMAVILRLLFLIGILFVSGVGLQAQTDTLVYLRPEQLTEEDIRERKVSERSSYAISATRSLEQAGELPFSVWVVTAEDILLNGFVTLADVLKAAPGMRVSQPGNGIEGETFLMNGLSGNQYVKILINDVPIKPAIVRGMPIGAQLPIRQAARIEVLYGPAGVIYGNEAFAGVINIILKETERPIFTQADLAFGSNGYNSLDLMFGGKLGKDHDIFRFSLYGSSTVRSTTDVYYDQSIYNTNQYLPLGLDTTLYTRLPNFRLSSPGDSFPKTAPLPHESRLFGVNLTWRGLRFNYNRMTREDHPALGLNPLAVGYSPSDKLADRHETFSLGFELGRNNDSYSLQNTLSLLRYDIEPNASATYVFDGLARSVYAARDLDMLPDSAKEQVIRNIYREYNADERFWASRGFDARVESRLHTSLGKGMSLDFGLQANLGGGSPAVGHYTEPTDLDFAGNSKTPGLNEPYDVVSIGMPDLNLFSQFQYKGRKLFLVTGLGYNIAESFTPVVTPRVAALFRIDSSKTLYASYSEGFRRPSLYDQVNSLSIAAPGVVMLNTGSLTRTEQNTYLEGGIRLGKYGSSSGLDVGAFIQNAYNLVRPAYLPPVGLAPDIWVSGPVQLAGLSQKLWGIKGRYLLDLKADGSTVMINDRNDIRLRWRHEFFFQYSQGLERLPGEEYSEVFNVPRWITQYRMTFQINGFELMFASNRHTSTLRKAVAYRDNWGINLSSDRNPTYRAWDAMVRVYLSKHFLLYVHALNLFNRSYAGLDATGTPDDLLFNAQQRRQFRFGVNYNMNN